MATMRFCDRINRSRCYMCQRNILVYTQILNYLGTTAGYLGLLGNLRLYVSAMQTTAVADDANQIELYRHSHRRLDFSQKHVG